jgi:hypothetical protein
MEFPIIKFLDSLFLEVLASFWKLYYQVQADAHPTSSKLASGKLTFLCHGQPLNMIYSEQKFSRSTFFCPNTFCASFCAAYLIQQRCCISILDDTSHVCFHLARLLTQLDVSVTIFNNRCVHLYSVST